MTAAAWPKVVVIPPGAVVQWRALREALAAGEPPCADDPDLWHSRRPDEIAAAVDACLGCPALAPCDAYATTAAETSGVWGARDLSQRRQEDRQ